MSCYSMGTGNIWLLVYLINLNLLQAELICSVNNLTHMTQELDVRDTCEEVQNFAI